MRDPISHKEAKREYGVAPETIKKFVDAGQLREERGPRRCGGRIHHCRLVSRSRLSRLLSASATRAGTRISGALPKAVNDAEPIFKLEKELEVATGVLARQCCWDPHPALGRKVGCGIGDFVIKRSNGPVRWRGPMASRADAEVCIEAMKDPAGFQFPGNPGLWLKDGIFQHEDGRRLFFTDRHAERFYKLPTSMLRQRVYARHLEHIDVTFPTSGHRGRWTASVRSQESIERLIEWRAGKTAGGNWLAENELWQDADGIWYSSSFIAKVLRRPLVEMHHLLRGRVGLISRYKEVPLGRSGKRKGRATFVHHENEVGPLLGLSRKVARKTRERPSREKHRQWLKWRNEGLSWGRIRDKHEDGTGEKLTREAIMAGVKYLLANPDKDN